MVFRLFQPPPLHCIRSYFCSRLQSARYTTNKSTLQLSMRKTDWVGSAIVFVPLCHLVGHWTPPNAAQNATPTSTSQFSVPIPICPTLVHCFSFSGRLQPSLVHVLKSARQALSLISSTGGCQGYPRLQSANICF